ncbi:DUF4350 domain-containing protein [Aurantiacibacter rhizosphaerae]|uniref:DUF4350 domain-containing protein n=1 Tax=Aurantiacibacter rhizosphaerae TaxID=2691582 RepID=A0A844XAU7_9SPHN|nr:DUF4350 domain-containing protein [Aurantiacibacter rhizosphaerae]MWV27086.1 DUF4350 domain-containing protein [Aurantiacibacter rhizosphaerae]
MSRRTSPFSPGAVLALLLVGALAFLLLLYALGQGWTGQDESDGGNHAAANGLNGFSGLVSLLENTGENVTVSRNRADMEEYGLTIITPPLYSDAEEIDEIIQRRIDYASGPTLLILPKWIAAQVPANADVESGDGWVVLAGANSPGWFDELTIGNGTRLAIGQTGGWQGLGEAGDLPAPQQVQALVSDSENSMRAMLVDDEGDVLAAELIQSSDYDDYEHWPVIVVFEPDLMNNYGMGDEKRADVALQLIDEASFGDEMPIRFDLTLNGLAGAENLLTLAFRPPFLAATLCMLLASIVIGWRAFRRFGPPIAEAPAMAQGKRQLARNGAALVERVRRWHLLKKPYEDMIGRRVAKALGLRPADTQARETAIDSAVARRGHDGPSFSRLAADLRAAERPKDIIRAAQALRTFERTLTQ